MNVAQSFGRALRPPPRVSVAEWADTYRILSSDTSAEPGRWRTDRTPYMREVMEALTPGSGVRRVYIMASAQMGKTELILNKLGHGMHIDPGPTLIVQSHEEMARHWSEERLAPMIQTVPELYEMFGPSKRNPHNKTMFKKFAGGFISIAYASSAPQLRSRPIRDLLLDEVDAYPGNVGGEGDPVDLAIRRTQTFGDRALVIAVSTPTIKGVSRIESLFAAGDQRRYHLPCPHCDTPFVPEFEMLVALDDGAYCECPHCHVLIDEAEKGRMLERGEWIPTAECEADTRSYHFSALIAPPGWLSWSEILDLHEKARASTDVDADDKMRVFVNTVLGLPYESSEGESADWEKLYNRRGKTKRGIVPSSVAVLTAGVDVQGDRLEVEIVGWGEGLRSWSIDYRVLPGDTSQPHVWQLLDDLLDEQFVGVEGARYSISRLAIDTGYQTQNVYQWARRYGPRQVMPIKGSSHAMATLIGSPTAVDVDVAGRKIKSGVHVWRLNVDAIKDHVTRWISLSLDDAPPGETPARWCEFPEYGESYFKGLCGEQRKRRGNRYVWEVVYKDQEPLDCRVYATAAALALGLDRWDESRWATMLAEVRAAANDELDVRTAVRLPAKRADDGKKKKRFTDSSYLR